MKRIPVDNRTIDEIAFGFIMAMNDEQAAELHAHLSVMHIKHHSKRAAMFLGVTQTTKEEN